MKLKAAFLFMAFMLASEVASTARLKDIANIRGVRENQLIGYGLVVGLKGTGDGKDEFTQKSIIRMLDTLGMKLDGSEIESKNVAAVMVTSKLPEFARSGNEIDISVHSIGAAKSLRGGTLIQTPLRAANKQVYAVAQGAVVIGSAAGGKTHDTAARIPNGAIIERDLDVDFAARKMVRLTLHNPDFTTSARVAHTINKDLAGKYAESRDSATVDVIVPPQYDGKAVELMASIETLQISPDTKARVVVNEKTGTVVVGSRVRISKIAIAHGNISVSVGSAPKVRGPASKKGGGNTATFGGEANVGEIVQALNGLGITPKDLITILQNIKAAGALHGELEIL